VLIGECLDALRPVGLSHDELIRALPDLARLIAQVLCIASKPREHSVTSDLCDLRQVAEALSAKDSRYHLRVIKLEPGADIVAPMGLPQGQLRRTSFQVTSSHQNSR